MADDDLLSMEGVYYSAQVPRDLAVLNVMGVVFDKVYFPGVYLPKEGFDQKEVDKEVDRIVGLGLNEELLSRGATEAVDADQRIRSQHSASYQQK